MTETTLCGYCVELPEQARASARQVTRCPLCKTELGVTGAGRNFRIVDVRSAPRRRGPLLIVLTLAAIAAPAALATWWLLPHDSAVESVALPSLPTPVIAPIAPAAPAPTTPEPPPDAAQVKRYAVGVLAPDARHKPDVAEPVTAVAALATATAGASPPPVPFTGPNAGASSLHPVVEHVFAQALRKVPEVDLDQFPTVRSESKEQAKQRIAELIQLIRKADEKEPNGYLRTLIAERADLAGLPLLMGDRCKISSTEAAALSGGALRVRLALAKVHKAPHASPGPKSASGSPLPAGDTDATDAQKQFWSNLLGWQRSTATTKNLQLLPAIVQIIPPEGTEFRRGLLDQFEDVAGARVTQMLARLALYDLDSDIRRRAAMALSSRPKDEYTELLLDGLRYPWLPVAERSADVIVALSRTDLLPKLIDVFDGPDPGAPFEVEVNGKKALAVRELVRINHHRNCLLCHAPAPEKPGRQMVLGAVPSPSEPLPPSSSPQSYSPRSNGPLVRADITYLRQDFSLMMPVGKHNPWPEMQRYDFLVRTRVLTDAERQAFLQRQQVNDPAPMSQQRQALLSALRGLTHMDAGTSAASWRKALAATPR